MTEKILVAFADAQLMDCISHINTDLQFCITKLRSIDGFQSVTPENISNFGFGYRWDFFMEMYPALKLPSLGDGLKCNEKGELVSRDDEFAEFRERLQKATVIRHVCG